MTDLNEYLQKRCKQVEVRHDQRVERIIAHIDARFDRQDAHVDARFNRLERYHADHLMLQLAAKEIRNDERRDFTKTTCLLICQVVTKVFGRACPCCGKDGLITGFDEPSEYDLINEGEFDHWYHRALNKPHHGWLICKDCHAMLTTGDYLYRCLVIPKFWAFQDAIVLERRRRCVPFKRAGPARA